LIGLWERSNASQTIKRLRGQTDAVASAHSVADYRIADDLGGEPAYRYLRDQAAAVGIRLASDMVPNHMGIDSTWLIEHPEWFLSRSESPFPSYRFDGPDLSSDSRIEIKIEDHYYDQTDAAVVFRRRERKSGHTSFIYHGNDGTTFAWNDTAQLNYIKAEVREQVMQTILQVARLFPIIRFDAAMTLAKKHVQRLWFPLPGVGGSIPSRAEDSMTNEEFDALMPNEFWREVVDRVAAEVPGTLLLAEAFWLLEGYFVRTLGMHRVYNSAFMNMLRDEENAKYRSYLKKTIEFDPDILKRYVNFMSNPDERTAIDQFGSEDRYFGVCTLLATLPGLPMFGHGQIEGFTEKYGMEYKQARMDEWPNEDLIARHQREIAPLLKNRQLFAGSSDFFLYDFWTENGTVDENVFAYSNLSYARQSGPDRAIVFFNNRYNSTRGTIHTSAASMDKGSGNLRSQRLTNALRLASSDEVIVAYKDRATGLEYLRRSRDIDHHGLNLELRAYQYVVLQNWRELQSTATHPWDRLCDALNGGGVYNLDEALSKLRLRPLHESLRQLLSPPVIQSVIDLAEDATTVKAGGFASQSVPMKPQQSPTEPASSADKGTLQNHATHADDGHGQETILELLREKAERFYQTLEQLDPSVPPLSPEHFAGQIAISIRALSTLSKQAERLVQGSLDAPLVGWAAAMAWSVLQYIHPDPTANLEIFDQLQLRSALSETFSSLGLEGEDSWRAAARVRVLLEYRTGSTAMPLPELLASNRFWNDPDVRWLIGVSEFEGHNFFNQELFERLLLWLLLPELVSQNASRSAPRLEPLRCFSAKALASGYEIEAFRAMLQPAMTPPRPEASPRLNSPGAANNPPIVDSQDQSQAAARNQKSRSNVSPA
jgi:glycosidase